MCGFAGYIHNYGTFDKEEVIHKMADASSTAARMMPIITLTTALPRFPPPFHHRPRGRQTADFE